MHVLSEGTMVLDHLELALQAIRESPNTSAGH